MPYTIAYLADHKHHLETVSRWYWEEWDKHEGWILERSLKFAEQGCNKDHLDIILIALNETDECLGTIQARKEWGIGEEIPNNLKQYSPWLGSLYVREDQRGTKLAYDLCHAIKQSIIKIDIKNCYAATGHLDNFFKTQKGNVIDETFFANEQMRIYAFSLIN